MTCWNHATHTNGSRSRQRKPKTLKARQEPCDRETGNMHRISQLRFVLILQASRFNDSVHLSVHPSWAVTRGTCRFGDGPMAEPFEHFRWIGKQHFKIRVQSASTFAMLEPEIGSCTISNQTKSVCGLVNDEY